MAAVEQLQERLDEEFPQFDDITKRIVGYLYDRIYDPDKPRTAVFIPIVSVQGLGKSTYGAAFWRYLGIVQGYIEHRCVDGEPFMPVESILKLAERQPDPMFGVRGVLVIDEMHRILAPQEEPDYVKLYSDTYDETLRATREELLVQWERSQREGHRQLVIESVAGLVNQPPPNSVPIPLAEEDDEPVQPNPPDGAPQQGGKKKRRQQQQQQRPTVSPPVTTSRPLPAVPPPQTIVIQLPENREGAPLAPPKEIELESQKAAKTAATAAVAAARKNWRLYLERRQILRDALSGNGEVAVRNSPLPDLVKRLRVLVGGFALESLNAKEKHERLIRAAEAELVAVNRVLETMPVAQFVRAKELRAESNRVNGDYQRALKVAQRAAAAVPTGGQPPPADPNIAVWEARLLEITEELESLPTADETKIYDSQITERTRKEEAIAKAKREYEEALAKLEESLIRAISEEKLAEGLLEAEPELMNAVGEPDAAEPLEFLLTEIDFMKRRLSKQPQPTIQKILTYMRSRPEVPSRRADGVFIFGLGNYPAYDEKVTERASNPRDPDSCAAADEAFRASNEGRMMFETYTLARIGRAVAKRGDRDDDQASMISRLGGYFEPRRRLTSKKWHEIIRRNLRQLKRKALNVMANDFKYEVEEIVFDDSVIRMLFESGANAESDLRLFTPHYDAFTSVVWPSLKKVLEKGGTGKLEVAYDFDKKSLEFRAHPKAPAVVAQPTVPGDASSPIPVAAQPSPRVLSVGFTPNMELQRIHATAQLSEDEEELLAYREAARAVTGAIIFGTLPKAVPIVPSRGRSQSAYWTRPAPQLRAWGYQFGDMLSQLAAVRAEYRWTSGAPYDETRAYRDQLRTALTALYREFNGEHGTASGVAAPLRVFQELTPSWFQNLTIVSNVFKGTTASEIFALSEAVVSTIIGSDDFEPMIRRLANQFLTLIRAKQPITNEIIQQVFLAEGARFTIDLHFRLNHLDPGSVRVPPERCDYVLAKKREEADVSAPVTVQDQSWRTWLASFFTRGDR